MGLSVGPWVFLAVCEAVKRQLPGCARKIALSIQGEVTLGRLLRGLSAVDFLVKKGLKVY